ncbi:MAG: hypothetical protein ACTS46_00705 [Candidatus Hodgkinia cicadicola]
MLSLLHKILFLIVYHSLAFNAMLSFSCGFANSADGFVHEIASREEGKMYFDRDAQSDSTERESDKSQHVRR